MTEITAGAFLLDLDGVLLDSTPAVTRVWKNWALERGFDPEQVVRMAHGRPSLATIRDLLPGADHEKENREVEWRELHDLEGVVALPGAIELLTALPPDRWAIVTSCTAALARARLRAGGLPQPKFLVTADDVRIGKPDPEPYLKGAEKVRVAPENCVVVEDVPAGIRAGRAAGARVIALQTTVRAAELAEAGADWIAVNCAAISVAPVEDGVQVIIAESQDWIAAEPDTGKKR